MEHAGHVAQTDWVAARVALMKDLTRLRDQFGRESLDLPRLSLPQIARRSLETGSPAVNH